MLGISIFELLHCIFQHSNNTMHPWIQFHNPPHQPNYNEVADDDEIIHDPEKKELLRKSILGHPDLLSVEMADKNHNRFFKMKMTYDQYHEHVMEICHCQSIDISCQEMAPTQKRIAEGHEQEEDSFEPTSTPLASLER